MEVLDTAIAAVILPHIAGSLSATTDEATWVLTSYLVANAVILPASSWFSLRFGRRNFLLFCISLFTVASFACGAAQSLGMILLARAVQGAGGGALQPLSQSILLESFPPEKRGSAMAVFALGVVVAPVLGPTLGGWLTDQYSWRWAFYINIPIGVVATFLIMRFVKDPPYIQSAKPGKIDAIGLGLLAVWIGTLQVILDKGQEDDWFGAMWIRWAVAVLIIALVAFLARELIVKNPIVNLKIFKDRNFVASNVFIFLIGVVLFATLALLPPMLQDQMNYPVVLTGLVTAPRGLGLLAALTVVGPLIARFGARAVIAMGLAFTTYSLWQMTQFSLLMGYWPVIISGVVQGLGIGFVYVPTATVAFTTLPGALRNEGTAFFNLLRNLGSSIGISVVMFLLTQNAQRVHASLASDITPYNVVSNPAVVAAHVDTTTIKGLTALNAAITNQATMIAYIDDFWLIMVMTLLTIPFLLLIKDVKPAAGGHTAVLE